MRLHKSAAAFRPLLGPLWAAHLAGVLESTLTLAHLSPADRKLQTQALFAAIFVLR